MTKSRPVEATTTGEHPLEAKVRAATKLLFDLVERLIVLGAINFASRSTRGTGTGALLLGLYLVLSLLLTLWVSTIISAAIRPLADTLYNLLTNNSTERGDVTPAWITGSTMLVVAILLTWLVNDALDKIVVTVADKLN